MAGIAVEDFMSSVEEDEGWMDGLDPRVVQATLHHLEAVFPPGSTLTRAMAARLREGLATLATLSRSRQAGELTDAVLIDEVMALAGARP